MTSPYAAAAASAVLNSFGMRSFARADSPAWDNPIELEVIEWELTVDEERIPHAELNLTIKTPDDATLALLDPRNEVYIEIDAGYVYPNGDLDIKNYVTLGLRRCEDGPAKTSLRAASEEAFVDDGNVPIDRGGSTTSTKTYVHQLISEILTTYTDTAIVPTIDNQVGNVTLPSPHSMTYRPTAVIDAVEQAKTWASAVDAVLWCDQQRVWRFWPTPGISGSPVGSIATTTNMVDYKRVRSRDDGWANRILATYEDDTTAWYLLPSSPTPSADTTSFRDRVYRSAQSVVPAGATVGATGLVSPADPAIAELLNRTKSRGRRLSIETIAHLWVRAGHYIEAVIDGNPEDAIVSAFTVRSTGAMTIHTRYPEE